MSDLTHGFEFDQASLKLRANADYAEPQGIAKIGAHAEIDLEAAFLYLASLSETEWDDKFVESAIALLKGAAPE